MKIFDENGRHIGDLKEDNDFTLGGCLQAFIVILVFILLTLIVAFFSKWWGNIGYWIGFPLSFVLYSVLFFYIWIEIKSPIDFEEYFSMVMVWLSLSILVVVAFDFTTSMITGQDYYLIFGGLDE